MKTTNVWGGLLLASVWLLTAGSASGAETALLIGNSDYEGKCETDLANVPGDVADLGASLAAAGYTVVSQADRSAIEMFTDLEVNEPPSPDKYVVYFGGHGDEDGDWLAAGCDRLQAPDLVGILFDPSRLLVIVDAEASGEFAARVNALDPRICTIASTTGTDDGTAGVFTPCFVDGLNGLADADDSGTVTVAEAAAYAATNCGDGSTTPTWDGDCPDCVIGVSPISVDETSWGRTKASYR